MAHFYGEIKGSGKSTATRCGTKNTGIQAHIRGWNLGCEVVCHHQDGKDYISIYKTGGTDGPTKRVLITELMEV